MLPDDYKLPANLYKYNLPEDYVMQPEHRQKLDALVTKTGISNSDAQTFVDLHIELTEDFVDRLMKVLLKIHRKITVTICLIVTGLNILYNVL